MGHRMEPLPEQAPPSEVQPCQPPLRCSIRLSKLQLLQPSLIKQEGGEDSEGDPIFQNPEMPEDTFYDSSEEHVEVEDGGNGNLEEDNGSAPPTQPVDPNSTQHLFREGTWSQSYNIFLPKPSPYLGSPSSLKNKCIRMPTYLHFFGLFWIHTILHCICIETNRYAQEDDGGSPKGGHD